jgi:nicotinate dehydrogenase subunit B
LDGDALKQGLDSGKRIFDTACAVCHAATGGVGNFGVRPLLSLNTSVSESAPDNLLRIIQDGIDAPATDALGYMPGFKDALDDQQIADLTLYIRARFAPEQAAWTDVAARSAAVRRGVH